MVTADFLHENANSMKDIQRKRWRRFHIRLKRFMKNDLAPIHDQENSEEKNKFAPLPLPFCIPTQKHLYPFLHPKDMERTLTTVTPFYNHLPEV